MRYTTELGDVVDVNTLVLMVYDLCQHLDALDDEIAEMIRDGDDETVVATDIEARNEHKAEYQWLRDLLQAMEDYRADIAIHEDHFEAYIRDRVIEDLGGESELPPMVSSHIDWEGVANDYRSDYTECAGYLFIAG